jgi:putative membrane protein
MRQLNFLLFFVLCFGLVLFSIENTQIAAINLIPGVQIEAPLSIELLLAIGTGAILAWIFSLWDQLQRQVESWKAQRELKQKNKKIEELEKTLAELQEESATELKQDATLGQSEIPKSIASVEMNSELLDAEFVENSQSEATSVKETN